MFAGINYVENENEGKFLKSMRSKENELVAFVEPFDLTKF